MHAARHGRRAEGMVVVWVWTGGGGGRSARGGRCGRRFRGAQSSCRGAPSLVWRRRHSCSWAHQLVLDRYILLASPRTPLPFLAPLSAAAVGGTSHFPLSLSFPLFAALWRWRTRRGTAWRRSSAWAPSRRSRSVPGQLPLTTTMDDGSAVRARTCKSLSWCHGIQLLSRCCLHRSMSSADRSLDIAIDASVVVHRRTYRSDHPHLSPHSAAEAAPNWPCTFPA